MSIGLHRAYLLIKRAIFMLVPVYKLAPPHSYIATAQPPLTALPQPIANDKCWWGKYRPLHAITSYVPPHGKL